MNWLLRFLVVCFVVLLGTLLGFRVLAELRETKSNDQIMPLTGTLVRTESGRIYVERYGDATNPALLFVHGSGAWSGFWREPASAIARRGYHVVAFDLPPFGFSDRAEDGDYSRVAQARRIIDLVSSLNIRPTIIAHSFGAGAATEAVMADTSKFAGLVLVSGALALDQAGRPQKTMPLVLRPIWLREAVLSSSATNPLLTRALLKTMLFRKDAATQDVAELLQRPMAITGSTQAAGQWLPSLLTPATDARSFQLSNYAELDLPLALIWGDSDTVTPLPQGQEIAELAGVDPPVVLNNVGHIPHLEAPEAFQDALLSILADRRFAQ